MKVSGGKSQNNLTNLQSRTDLFQEVPNIFYLAKWIERFTLVVSWMFFSLVFSSTSVTYLQIDEWFVCRQDSNMRVSPQTIILQVSTLCIDITFILEEVDHNFLKINQIPPLESRTQFALLPTNGFHS